MNPTLVCALAVTSLGWIKLVPPFIAQAITAPIASVIYGEDDYLFIEWVFDLLKRFRAPNKNVLVYDNNMNPKQINLSSPKEHFFGLVLIDSFATERIFLEAIKVIAPGGTIIFHANKKISLTVRNEVRSAA